VTDQKNKTKLDEQSFGKLLEAAYVLQEHNREMRQIEESLERQSEELRQQEVETQTALDRGIPRPAEARPDIDYTLTLAEIVEAQHQIQIRHLELDKAMLVVVERTARMTNASGAAIGMLEGKTIQYRAGAGTAALPVGSEVPLETAICAICLRTGQVLRTPDINTEFLFDPDLCRLRDIQSLAAVPIYHDGNIVGALELYFSQLQGFVEQDIHTCRLMAGLITEAIGRSANRELKKSAAEERSSMIAAIEELRPNLVPLTETEGDRSAPGTGGVVVPASTVSAVHPPACWKCGNRLLAEEQFCGKCGAPQVSEAQRSELEDKIVSAQRMQKTAQGASASGSNGSVPFAESPGVGSRSGPSMRDINFPALPGSPDLSADHEVNPLTDSGAIRADAEAMQSALSVTAKNVDINFENPSAGLEKIKQHDANWSSAAKARDFLESVADTAPKNAFERFWRAHRGDVYLALAVILVAIVVGWGVFSSKSVNATGSNPATANANRRKPAQAPDANLSAFDRLLISLGLAEEPAPPEDKGNPSTQVWIDLHTALYYCPGDELYGKTPKGRFAAQRDAQLDQFEPASRKVCE
jgi:hypothetical protein